ncbi:hypothetical protein [uncultured Serinicoccus sp.]|uniref:hypothetical protein n=1 Tax=uncultured Serinicoccus sp. TaxID=735514 RepID=UPI002614E539|nr:hypothetical protein [uncultured Serinicoccus sp.]
MRSWTVWTCWSPWRRRAGAGARWTQPWSGSRHTSSDRVAYLVGAQHAFTQVLITTDDNRLIITTTDGEVLAERTRPAPGITYVGNGQPTGPRPKNT